MSGAILRKCTAAVLVGLQAFVLVGCDRAEPSTSPALNTKPVSLTTTESSKTSNTPSGVQNASHHVRRQPQVQNSVVIGIDADMTSGAAQSGEAIRRGVVLAIDEINASGGLLGRTLECVVRDHRGNPARGVDNIAEFSQMRDVLAVVGGIHTPVALQELDIIHREKLIYLDPWAAGTPIVDNGRDPNFVFRVSVRDEYAGEFLVQSALDRGYKRIGLLLERTGWGRSNERAMLAALESRGLEPSGVQWFNWGERSLAKPIEKLEAADTDVMIFVGNPLEGVVAVKNVASLPAERRLPIISHWGITGGNFTELTSGSLSKVNLLVLQTYSFISPPFPERGQKLFEAYAAKFSCSSPREVVAPVGTAHAYEIVMLLAAAVRRADSLDRSVVRSVLESPSKYAGVIRDYDPPFRPDHHDALDATDFILARYDENGVIVPVHLTCTP